MWGPSDSCLVVPATLSISKPVAWHSLIIRLPSRSAKPTAVLFKPNLDLYGRIMTLMRT